MKKIATFYGVLIIGFSSCKNDPKDIDVSKLTTPCEYANAYISIVDELYKLKWQSEPTFENSMKFEALSKKDYELIETSKKLKIDITQCVNYKEAKKARRKDNHFKLNEWWKSSTRPEEIKKYQEEAALKYQQWDIEN